MPDYVRIFDVIGGRSRDFARGEIDANAIESSRELIVRLLTTGCEKLPALAGYTMTIAGDVHASPGRCLAMTMVRDRDSAAMAVIGAVTHQRCGSRLWNWLRGQVEAIGIVPDAPERQPATPWAGYAMLPPSGTTDRGLEVFAGIVRFLVPVLGWSWLDHASGAVRRNT